MQAIALLTTRLQAATSRKQTAGLYPYRACEQAEIMAAKLIEHPFAQ